MRELRVDSKGNNTERKKTAGVETIRLDWEVDGEGYRIEQREARVWTSLPLARGGVGDDPYLETQRDIPAGPCIVPNGWAGTGRYYRVGVREDDIYLDLANTVGCSSLDHLDTTEASARALAFTNKWGFLANPVHELPLSEFFKQAVKIRKALEDAKRKGCIRFNGWLHGPIIPAVERGTLVLYPQSLLGFCWLEFFQAVQGGGHFYRCGNTKCATFGPYPKTGRPPMYCSATCRKAASRARKKKR